MFDLLQARDDGPTTFAEPGGNDTFGVTLFRSALMLNPVTGPPLIVREIARNRDAYGEIFRSSERQQRLVDNVFAQTRSQEEVYDRRIAAVKEATGVDLENPLRGGYAQDARRKIRDEVRGRGMESIDGTGGVPDMQHRIFNERLDDVRRGYPDQAEALTFGDMDTEARQVAAGAEREAQTAQSANVNPVVSLGAQFAGGLWAGRRDPIFVGSMFLGPTSAVGKAALSRIVSAGLFQGAFNAGISALEQPAVQAWRADIGARSGVQPAMENVGMAFLFGMIPGAAIRGVQEEMARAARPAVQRIMAGRAEPGDAEVAMRAVGVEPTPQEAAAIRMGEDIQAADRAVLPPPARGVSPEPHDDLTASALRHAEDPVNQPSPEAVAAVSNEPPPGYVRLYRAEPSGPDVRPEWIRQAQADSGHADAEGRWFVKDQSMLDWYRNDAGGPTRTVFVDVPTAELDKFRVTNVPEARGFSRDPENEFFVPRETAVRKQTATETEIQSRIAEAQPRTRAEAAMIATEAMEEAGNRNMVARLNADLADEAALRGHVEPPAVAEPPPARSKDPLDKVPFQRDDGTPTLLSRKQVAEIGQRDTEFAMLVRSCQ